VLAVDDGVRRKRSAANDNDNLSELQPARRFAWRREMRWFGEKQVAKTKSLSEQFKAAVLQAVPPSRVSIERSPEEREKLRAEIRAAITNGLNEYKPKLAVIVTPEQMKRLEEITLQSIGASALKNETVAKALGFSDEQKTKIAELEKQLDDKLRETRLDASDQESREKRRTLSAEYAKTLMDVLTQEQKDKLESMKGKAFDVSKLGPRFGGRSSST
jgi:hypothetical protein